MSFNLTREPWIPVETLDGRLMEMSTREVLAQAHFLRGLAASSPLVTPSLIRHLLAILYRAYGGPGTMREWKSIASAGVFDHRKVDAYLDSIEDRMDLFHPRHPFGQTRGLADRFGEYAAPIDELEHHRSQWGGARSLFQHRPATPPPQMLPSRAARALLAHHAFATGGLIKKPGEPDSATAAPLVRGAVVMIRGGSLFSTLTSNLVPYGRDRPVPGGGAADACAWEQGPLPEVLARKDEPKRAVLGYLDLLTWQSRRIELLGDGTVVTGFINAVGHGFQDPAPRDPMVTYRRDEKRGWMPVRIDPHRAFWRQSAALFEVARNDTAHFERPRAIDLMAAPEAIEVSGDAMFDVEVFGMAAEKSRVDTVRVERIPARGRCFNDPDAGEAVRDALTFADQAVDALGKAVYLYSKTALSPGTREPDSAAVRAFVDSLGCKPAAWSELGVRFEHFMRLLGDDPRAAVLDFERSAVEIAGEVFRGVSSRADSTGGWLKARALGERALRLNLPRVPSLPTPPVATEGEEQ